MCPVYKISCLAKATVAHLKLLWTHQPLVNSRLGIYIVLDIFIKFPWENGGSDKSFLKSLCKLVACEASLKHLVSTEHQKPTITCNNWHTGCQHYLTISFNYFYRFIHSHFLLIIHACLTIICHHWLLTPFNSLKNAATGYG